MPGKIKVKILAGRNLPVMDRSGDTTDAYVELKFGNTTYKTDVCRKSLNPQWNSEWYKFEVDDAELQDEPLQIRLMDHDTYSANDAIGKVYINLNPLLLPGILPPVKNIWTLEAAMNTSAGSQGSVMTGWIPVYDTMHGIRGEVNIIVKVELFSDFNKFRQSSCGIQFFYSPNIPYGYHAQMIHGFVEELVVSDDPEYQWIDKIRTPRASNEARQTLFFKLSGEVQRKIGLKALDLGGNAVIGYLQNFDLEGESGIVARGIGTAVTLVKLHDVLGFPCDSVNIEEIALALPSRTKMQTERSEADDSALFIPSPASYPLRIPTRPARFSHAKSSSSLTRLEIPSYGAMRRKRAKRIPFFRSNTLSTLSLRTFGGSDFTPPEYMIDETVRSLRTMLMPVEDTKKQSPKSNRLSRQIQNLRDKIDSVGEENHLATETDSDADPVRSFIVSVRNPTREPRTFKEPRTGKIMAALLIGSIQSMPLQNIGNGDPTSPVSSSNEQSNEKETKMCCEEEVPVDPKENISGDVKTEERLGQDVSSSIGETEMSSFDDDNSSADDDSSEDNTSYNILRDSRYSLDGSDFDRGERSLSSRERTEVARSSAESYTDSTLQVDSDATYRLSSNLNLNLGSGEGVELRNDEIPIITVDMHGSTDSDASIDSSRLLPSNENSSPYASTSRDLMDTDGFVSKSIHPLNNKPRDVDDARQPLDASARSSQRSNLRVEKNEQRGSATSGSDGSSYERMHRVHLTRHQRDLCRARSLSAQREMQSMRRESPSPSETESRVSTDQKRNDSVADSSRKPTDTSLSYEEIRARTSMERQRCMLDLIKLIDTKMMVSERATTRYDKRTVSLRSKRKKREKTREIPTSLKKSPSRGDTSTRKHHKNHGRDVSFCVPRVCSTPNCLSSDQQLITSFRATSRSCDSSPLSLSHSHRHRYHHPNRQHHRHHRHNHYHARVSLSSKRAAVVTPFVTIDRRSDVFEISRRSLENRGKTDVVALSDINDGVHSKPTTNTNQSASRPSPSVGMPAVVIRKCTSVCNLNETLCHIDRTEPTNTAKMTYNSCVSHPSPDLRQQDEAASVSPSYPLPAVPSVAAKVSQSPATRTLANVPLHRRSSDSDLSVTPKGNSLGNNDRSMAAPLRTPAAVVRSMNQDTLEMLEYPFITMQHYPPGFILHIGGLVSSRSVKLLERISNLEEPEGRDAWWTEIRMEVRSHARALACNVVIGYKEETSICDDVCVLSASGTAAVINLHNSTQEPDSLTLNKLQLGTAAATAADTDREKSQQKSMAMKTEKADSDTPVANHSERQNSKACRHSSESNDHEGPCGQAQLRCNLCHLPYCEKSVPFRVNVSKCAICKRARVPDVMFTTIEVPANIPTTGRGCFIQATVCKNKKDLRGELNAKEISDSLPFLEYELHSLLLNKLKMKGMNAIFGLRLQVSVGERLIIGMAVGTALYLTALPPPTIPQIASGNSWHNDEQLAEIQKSIVETVKKNREFYHLKPTISEAESTRITSTSDTDESDEDLPELDLGVGTRDACVLEVDDIEDLDRISSLMDDRPPDDFHVVNMQTIPGLEDLEIVRNLQMFTQVSRTKIPAGQFATMPSKFFARLLQSLCFKLRRMVPCALCDMQFRVALPEQDEIQLTVVGMALGLGEPLKTDRYKKKVVCRSLSKDQMTVT
ncbi:uncharacterized protein LOC116846631 isoform X2 [Odontomachus brunneus]|uniref:uncharacterized protein LOC116846631 isoform X2 n=1 Tax=Odontomachus brunneus TaxID=486640 RepID=UPI0013F1A850|nr:uncharacterized protein LOC116846631 isoform X2 [Odontomachus brunneus]